MANVIRIPLPRSGETLVIRSYELSETITSILRSERVPLEIWMDCARGFLAEGKLEEYTNLLLAVKAEEENQRWNGSSRDKFVPIQALCSLADLKLQEARLAEDEKTRSELLNKAQKLYLQAQNLDVLEMLPQLGLGEISLMNGNANVAREQFTEAAKRKCNGRNSIAATLALARLEFSQGQFVRALTLFRKALQQCPTCPAEVRLGIAACHFRMGEPNKAEAAYKRVLELDPRCTQALLGLAVLTLAVGVENDSVRDGSRLLARAFQEDPDDPHTLTLLAHFSLQQGLAEHARSLARAAIDRLMSGDEKSLRAQAMCLLGRAHHALQALPEAVECYNKALQLDSSLTTARLGFAQLAVLGGDPLQAVPVLGTVLEERPAWTDALHLLAPLLPRDPNVVKGVATARHFKTAAEKARTSAELWEMLADVMAAADPAAGLNACLKAIELRREAAAKKRAEHRQDDVENPAAATVVGMVPARLLNNAAVLQLRSGEIAAASRLMAEAMASAAAGGLGDLGPQARVTLGFNAARVREASGDLQGAEAEYKEILAQFPQYADCHVRLACIAKARGDLTSAEEEARAAAASPGREADALALLAELHLERDDIGAASKCLEDMQQAVKATAGGSRAAGVSTPSMLRVDPYIAVARGNIFLATARIDFWKEEEKWKNTEQKLTHALKHFLAALDVDAGNVVAANGIGCVLAESGRLYEAKDVFLQVQEVVSASDGFMRLPDAWLNLANTFIGLSNFSAAEQTYVKALKRFPELSRDSRCLLNLAKAQHDGGEFARCQRSLAKALHVKPGDAKVRFNLAYVLQKRAHQTSEKCQPFRAKPKDKEKQDGAKEEKKDQAESMSDPIALAAMSSELTHAVVQASTAHRLFTGLLHAGQAVTGIAASIISEHLVYVEKLHKNALEYVKEAQLQAQIVAARQEEQRLRLQATEVERELKQQREEEERKALERIHQQQAEERAARLQRLHVEWRQAETLKKAAKAGDSSAIPRGQRSGADKAGDEVDALFAMGSDEEDEEYVPGQGEEEEDAGATGAAPLAAAELLSSLSSGEDEEREGSGKVEKQGRMGTQESARGKSAKTAGAKRKSRLKKRGGSEIGVEENGGKRARQEDGRVADEEAAAKATIAEMFGSDSE